MNTGDTAALEAAAEAIRRRMPALTEEQARRTAGGLWRLERLLPDGAEDGRFTPLPAMTDGEEADVLFPQREAACVDLWDEQTAGGTRRNIRLLPGTAGLMEATRTAAAEARVKADTTPVRLIGIDIETYSPVDLSACGVYKYAEHPDFEVLLFACSVNGGPVAVYDLACGERLPERITAALTDPAVLKTAYNAAFERVCLGRMLGLRLDPRQWECTMVRGAMGGLPLGLDACGEALGIERKKMREGRDLIRYFCMPCRATKANGGRTRNLPGDAPDRWETFKAYCRRDVEAEQEIRQRLGGVPFTPEERALYAVDQDINDRGVAVDLPLAEAAARMDAAEKARLSAEAVRISGLENPNSVQQLKAWLESVTGQTVDGLRKAELPGLISRTENAAARRLLAIRDEMGRTSTKKYEAIQRAACRDGRVRGLLQFYGAQRTGRWAGRLVQVQNLPQNHIDEIGTARRMVREGDTEGVRWTYGSISAVLSQLVRTAFIAPAGRRLLVCDFSAIEARVIAWLADEEWRLQVFRTHGKIYEASAAMMFHVPVESITKTDPRRQKGKIAELALGYQGGVGALSQMGGERMGLSEDEMNGIVEQWREANPAIVRLWSAVEQSALMVLRSGEPFRYRGLTFAVAGGALRVQLPSGRSLFYPEAREEKNRFGRRALTYMGVRQTTKRWGRLETYGGKLTENIVQAIARDCLALTIRRLEQAGLAVVFHVHDEVIIEAAPGQTLEQVERIFSTPMPWAASLPLRGAGYETEFYLKD